MTKKKPPKAAEAPPADEASRPVKVEATVTTIDTAIDLETDTLRGDIRDAILDRIRMAPKPWAKMSEYEQCEAIASVDHIARHLVQEAIRIITAKGQVEINATLEQVQFKDGIKATITLSRTSVGRHALADAVGSQLLIVVLNEEEFDGERSAVAADPDQPGLPLAGEGAVFDDTANGVDRAAEAAE